MTSIIADYWATWVQNIEAQFYPEARLLHNFPRHLMMDDFSCGARCASMVLSYYRRKIPVDIERELKTTRRHGTSETSLKQFFTNRGFTVESISGCSMKKLRRAIDGGHPVIATFYRGEHWAVIKGYDRPTGKVFIADPAWNSVLSACDPEEFSESFDRYALVIARRKFDR